MGYEVVIGILCIVIVILLVVGLIRGNSKRLHHHKHDHYKGNPAKEENCDPCKKKPKVYKHHYKKQHEHDEYDDEHEKPDDDCKSPDYKELCDRIERLECKTKILEEIYCKVKDLEIKLADCDLGENSKSIELLTANLKRFNHRLCKLEKNQYI